MLRRQYRRRRRCRDVKMFLLGVFATIGVLYVWSFRPRCYVDSPRRTTETSARTVRAAIQNWQATVSATSCPTIETLVRQKHLDPGSSTRDPWGHNFSVHCTEDEVFVSSMGPDGIANTHDDIQVPKFVEAETVPPANSSGT